MQVYLNGSYVGQEQAKVSVTDRGFVFGDGVYEVIRFAGNRLFREREHLDRLREGLAGLQIGTDPDVLDSLPVRIRELIRRNEVGGRKDAEATVYIQITRGEARTRTHTFPQPSVRPTVYISTTPFEPYRELHEKGVDAITLPDVRWARCHLKTINLVPNILARQQANDAGADSAVMIRDGLITESPNANIFGVLDGCLYTYPESPYILNGITRRLVLELAAELQIPVRTVPVQQKEIGRLQELFFTGTTTDIQPVVRLDGNPVGEGRPGKVVRQIQDAYRKKLYG